MTIANEALGRQPMPTHRPRKALVAIAGGESSDQDALALVDALQALGIETMYLGREESASVLAATAVNVQADAVELCLAGGGSVLLLRELLRELVREGRRDVSIVVHRPPRLVTYTQDGLGSGSARAR